MQYLRKHRGLQQPNTILKLPFAGNWVLLFFLLTTVHLQQEPGHPGRSGMVSAALSQFCGLETIRIEVEQRIQDEDGGSSRLLCRGNVTLTSCEGQCISSVAPSVVSSVGFVKKCTCCREIEMRSTKIELAHCVTDEGACISHYVHEMVIREPSRCACQPCSP